MADALLAAGLDVDLLARYTLTADELWAYKAAESDIHTFRSLVSACASDTYNALIGKADAVYGSIMSEAGDSFESAKACADAMFNAAKAEAAAARQATEAVALTTYRLALARTFCRILAMRQASSHTFQLFKPHAHKEDP